MDPTVSLFVIVLVAVVFGSIVAIVALPMWFRERTKQSAHKLISEAIAKGQTLDPALMERLTADIASRQSSPRRTLGSAVVMIALSGGFLAAHFMSGGGFGPGEDDWWFMPSAILGALGLAFLVLAIVDYSSQKKKTDA
ncbi:MAG TPA: DUF6249 domain-containing protein [Caulobacterales bacterium]|nr:DUF6249 domain-containing protein [Caulobacterales bacterium]